MPIYYAPPQPVQASPHVPIGNQGDAPPKRTLHGFYAVRSLWSEPSWPAQYGPQIVAQTLVYGQEPPRRTNAQLYQIRATWPEPWWPAQSEPANAAFNIPLANQPPASQLARIYNLRGLWPETTWPSQAAPRIAPQTLIYGDQPPPRTVAYYLRSVWPEVSWPSQYGAKIVPLTLVYGDQPPGLKPRQPIWPPLDWSAQSEPFNAGWNVLAALSPQVPPSQTQWQIWSAWQPTWNAQSAAPNAAWNVQAAATPRVPPPPPQWQVWSSWQSPPQPAQRATTLVQLTGDQPPKFTQHLRMSLRGQWSEANWPAQARGPNASWNVPRVDNPPPKPWVRWNIWTSWNIPPDPKQAKNVQSIEGVTLLDTDVVVPYLIEDVLSAALMRIASIYCVANVIGTTGSVTIQDPIAFTRVHRGTTITITLGGTIKGSGTRKAQAPYGSPDAMPPFPDPKLQRH